MRQFLRKNDFIYLDAAGSLGAVLLHLELEIEFEGGKAKRYRQSWRDSTWVLTDRSGEAFIGPGFDGTNGLKNPLDKPVFITDLIYRATFSGAVKRGELFVRASIRSGGLTHGIPLAQGYLHTMKQAIRLGEFESSIEGQGLIVTNEGPSTLVNNVALTRLITVPSNARWRLHGGRLLNADNVARNCSVDVRDASDNPLHHYVSGRAVGANGDIPFPHGESLITAGRGNPGFPVGEGFDIAITWAAGGASAGGTAESAFVVEEWIET